MKNIDVSCCFTGYRPEKFGFPFEENCPEYKTFYARLSTAIAKLINDGCTQFYCGMAQGFDIAAGEHVALLKKLRPDIKLIGVVPFKGQEEKWTKKWQDRYFALLKDCDEVITLNDEYTRWSFSQRNRYMVDRSRYCITYFDGKTGGTESTLKYASKNGRQIINIYDTDPNEAAKSRYKCRLYLIPPDEN